MQAATKKAKVSSLLKNTETKDSMPEKLQAITRKTKVLLALRLWAVNETRLLKANIVSVKNCKNTTIKRKTAQYCQLYGS